MISIEENDTWVLVDPPANCQPIGLKWVFEGKHDEHDDVVKHKARLVAKGYMQQEGWTSRKSSLWWRESSLCGC
jgi:hypothetical protein